jgi:hypothetical protein
MTSDYLKHFIKRTDSPHTQRAVVAWLQGHYPSDWPSTWGTVVAHREACMLTALQALDAALADPKITRGQLRRRMLEACAAIAERGPEAVGLAPQ